MTFRFSLLLLALIAGCTEPEPLISCEAQELMHEYDNRDPDDDPAYEPEPCQEAKP